MAFDRAWILANEALGHLADHAGQPLRAVPLHIFRPADKALVGCDLEKRIDPPPGIAMQVFDFDDFHAVSPILPSLRGVKRRSNPDNRPMCRTRLLRFARNDICLSAPRDIGEDRFEVGEEQIRVLAHREVAESFMIVTLAPGTGARSLACPPACRSNRTRRSAGRAGIGRCRCGDAAAQIAVDAVKVQIAFEDAGAALHVMPQGLPALGLGRLWGDEARHGAGRELAAVDVRAVQPVGS